MSGTRSLSSGERHIPGYYFDQEKGKWFKLAHPASGGRYTASAVAKRRRTDRQETASQPVKSSLKASQRHSAGAYLLERSTTYAAHGLSYERDLLQARTLSLQPLETRRFALGGRPAKFVLDSLGKHVYIASARCLSVHDLDTPHVHDRPLHQQIRTLYPVAPFRSDASSLTWDAENDILLGTTIGDGHRPAEFLIRKGHWNGPAVCRTFRGSLWCSAAAPGKPCYMAGGSETLLFDPISDKYRQILPTGKTDTMTAEFASQNILLTGSRNGSIQIYDVRTTEADMTIRLHHGSPASGIARLKVLSTHQFIVSGLNSSLVKYDMRYLQQGQELVCYKGHKNEYDLSLNSLVICEGMLVVAQPRREVKIWSLEGSFLRSIETNADIHDMQFVRNDLYTLADGALEISRF